MSNSNKELKALGSWEAMKGLIAVIVGLGLHQLTPPKIQEILESLFMHLHLNPGTIVNKFILHDSRFLTPSNLTLVLVGSLVYCIIRFIEVYGLWNGYRWIQWFALLSGAVYLPFELYEMVTQLSVLSCYIFIINLFILGYLYFLLRENK